jgi:hypothetical protein
MVLMLSLKEEQCVDMEEEPTTFDTKNDIPSIDFFSNTNKDNNKTACIPADTLESGKNNDVATIKNNVHASGIMYDEQNKQQEKDISDAPLQSLFDERLYINGNYQDRAFLKPIERTSKHISSFYDFLASDYAPMNNKYRVNSKGPLL